MNILSLHSYPIKSCAGIDLDEAVLTSAGLAHDRRWMLVDEAGQFMTQRQHARMALIRPVVTGTALCLNAPGMPPLCVPLDGSELSATVKRVGVWRDTVAARAESAAAGQWFSDFLGHACRLFKAQDGTPRPSNDVWVRQWLAANPPLAPHFADEIACGFADGFPLLVTNQASLDELNEEIVRQGKPAVSMNRFRANIVVGGDDWQAWEEDFTAMLTVQAQDGAVRLALVKPCTRCPVPNIDQLTGVPGDEPGVTLARLHELDIGVVFGMNAIASLAGGGAARLRLRDAVTAD